MATLTVQQTILIEVEIPDEALADYDSVGDYVAENIQDIMRMAGDEADADRFTYGDDIAVFDEENSEVFNCN